MGQLSRRGMLSAMHRCARSAGFLLIFLCLAYPFPVSPLASNVNLSNGGGASLVFLWTMMLQWDGVGCAKFTPKWTTTASITEEGSAGKEGKEGKGKQTVPVNQAKSLNTSPPGTEEKQRVGMSMEDGECRAGQRSLHE